MRLVAHSDATAFLAAAGSLLAEDEPRHNLIFGICSTLVDAPDVYPKARLWTVEDGEVVGAFLMTPPYNILVARPRADEAVPFAAETLHAEGVELPGVGGALPEVETFARAWEQASGLQPRLRMAQGVYATSGVQMPEGVAGNARAIGAGDRKLVVAWLQAFEREALHEGLPRVNADEVFDRRLASSTAGLTLWEVDSHPVSLCGYGNPTPRGIRIGPVYTPPELRGNGYGSAVTAYVTQRLLDGDRDYCFLYTDLANPTSNSIYTKIGYSLACEAADYGFEQN
jgi:uncharacterized protein